MTTRSVFIGNLEISEVTPLLRPTRGDLYLRAQPEIVDGAPHPTWCYTSERHNYDNRLVFPLPALFDFLAVVGLTDMFLNPLTGLLRAPYAPVKLTRGHVRRLNEALHDYKVRYPVAACYGQSVEELDLVYLERLCFWANHAMKTCSTPVVWFC